jgi:hypothetical protein
MDAIREFDMLADEIPDKPPKSRFSVFGGRRRPDLGNRVRSWNPRHGALPAETHDMAWRRRRKASRRAKRDRPA